MKKNDKDTMQGATVDELVKKAGELRKKVVEETMKRQSTTVKNVRTVKNLRRSLAQVLSIKRIKELSKAR